MELQARKKNRAVAEPSLTAPGRRQETARVGGYNAVISIRCDTLLYNTIQSMVTASHAAQDFTYSSPSDVLRAALQAYKDGMELTALDEKGEKLGTTIRVDRATKDFYTSLPNRMRTKILERAIRTFMKQHR